MKEGANGVLCSRVGRGGGTEGEGGGGGLCWKHAAPPLHVYIAW